jgi:predicted alpha/beta superfamily hydrolase
MKEIKNVVPAIFITLLFITCTYKKGNIEERKSLLQAFSYYSNAVKDTFQISVQLPSEYYQHPEKKYPTVFLLDGNFYFPMLSAVINQYEQAGMLPPMILVGVGYKSLQLMDSLRNRDYLYPAPLPGDETKSVGGGLKFYSFITVELIKRIDDNYRIQKGNKALLGHSFGGYFALYTLLEQTQSHQYLFDNIIAASPSLWYHNNYIFQLPGELKKGETAQKLSLFISAGTLENNQWEIQPVKKLAKEIENEKLNNIDLESEVYTSLHHMDTGLITFIKGLQKCYPMAEGK